MTMTAVRERIERLRSDGERYTPAMVIVDLLLDVRTGTTVTWPLSFIDEELSRIGRRHLLSAVEVQALLDQLDVVLREAESRAHGAPRAGMTRSVPRSLFDREPRV